MKDALMASYVYFEMKRRETEEAVYRTLQEEGAD
jgi:hypothetical protein